MRSTYTLFFSTILAAVALTIFADTTLAQQQTLLRGTVDGTVTAIDGNIVQILQGKLKLDLANARIVSQTGQILSVAEIKNGMRILASVTGDTTENSPTVVADNILVQLDNEGALSSTLQAVDRAARSLTVFGQKILVNDETEIIDFSSKGIKEIPFEKLKVKKQVRVAVQTVGTDLIAISIIQIRLGQVVVLPTTVHLGSTLEIPAE
ncbi:MAG: hypothetical protein AB1489_23345 [Acidobacteriota bacterium]